MKNYYAGYSYMGIRFTYDSPCWVAYRFESKKDRDEWVLKSERNDQGNIVAEAITRKAAYKIAGIKSSRYTAEVDRDNKLVAVWR